MNTNTSGKFQEDTVTTISKPSSMNHKNVESHNDLAR